MGSDLGGRSSNFFSRWSYAREDFERKLHGRRKVTVTFIELPDTTLVQGSECDVVANLVTNDFFTLWGAWNQQIVVLLNGGVTKRPRSRNITRIRQPQRRFEAPSREIVLDEN